MPLRIVDAKHWSRPAANVAADPRPGVAAMLAAMDGGGDPAIRDYSRKFDGFDPQPMELRPWREYPLTAWEQAHLGQAALRIETFCRMQRAMYRDMETVDSCGRFGHRILAVESMAAYIPGGRFPLVSTALMTLIPARVAGVERRPALCPSDHPAVLAAASLAGATSFLRIGGAQAIAAAVFGYGGQAPVDMVVGPGNAYVNAAKALVQDRVKIDTLAGPSELLLICDDGPEPGWLAEDLLAQAEHDPLALAVLATDDRRILEAVRDLLIREQARDPNTNLGAIDLVLAQNREGLVNLADRMAPEHLHLATRPGFLDPGRFRHYGSLFIGAHSAVALGDYCSGPNHTLPTLGYARQKGGLQVGDFLRILTYQEVSADGFKGLAETALCLAEIEGLRHHGASLRVREPGLMGQ